jgi:hypothetical protein
MSDEPIIEREMVVVHRYEAHTLQYNVLTHEVTEEQTADDAIKILSIRPKQASEENGQS